MGNFLYKNKNNLNSNILIQNQTARIKDIMNVFFLDEKDVFNLQNFFIKIDEENENEGYITLNQLYKFLNESERSNLSPFIDHLFNIVDKKYNNKMSFEEFLPFLISYCLSSQMQLIEFVFGLIDSDHNKSISLGQIIELFSTIKNNEEIFFINHIICLEKYSKKKRGDNLTIDDFYDICQDLPFVYYYASKLQHKLRSNYISDNFWNKLEKKIIKKYNENSYKEDLKLQINIEDIRNKVLNERINLYKKKWETEKKEIENNKIYKEDVRLKLYKTRKMSDTDFYIDKIKEYNLKAKKDKDIKSNIDMNIYANI